MSDNRDSVVFRIYGRDELFEVEGYYKDGRLVELAISVESDDGEIDPGTASFAATGALMKCGCDRCRAAVRADAQKKST